MSIFSILFDHHIIPESCRDHGAFRGIDKQTFDIDSPANRIYLPANRELAAKLGVSPHPGRHVGAYKQSVCAKLDEITKTESPEERLAQIKTLIDAMRVGFLNGHLFTNPPIGQTREDIVSWIKKIVLDPKAYSDQYPDRLGSIRDIERRGADAGLDHLIKWLLYLDHPEREKLIGKEIARNPDVKLTAGNRDLRGTPWSSFAPIDDKFQLPPTTPANPRDMPLPPPFFPPLLGWLNEPEGLTRSDPRFAGAPPSFPAPNPDEQQLGQLPPSTAMPSPPQVLQFHPETGDLLRRSDGSPLTGPDQYNVPHDPADGPAVLRGMALFGAAMAVPALLSLLPVLAPMAVFGLAGAAAARAKPARNGNGQAFGTATSLHNRLNPDENTPSASNSGPETGVSRAGSQAASTPFDQTPMSTSVFDDRFGKWATPANGTMPYSQGNVESPPVAGDASLAEVRRLSLVNASNAGSVFASGSAPVQYLPPENFNDRFGDWRVQMGESQQQVSKPVGTFAGEPSYLIAPPIFGVNDSAHPPKDSVDWFSRWI